VPSVGIDWGSGDAFGERMAHEAVWEKRLRANAKAGLAASLSVMHAPRAHTCVSARFLQEVAWALNPARSVLCMMQTATGYVRCVRRLGAARTCGLTFYWAATAATSTSRTRPMWPPRGAAGGEARVRVRAEKGHQWSNGDANKIS